MDMAYQWQRAHLKICIHQRQQGYRERVRNVLIRAFERVCELPEKEPNTLEVEGDPNANTPSKRIGQLSQEIFFV